MAKRTRGRTRSMTLGRTRGRTKTKSQYGGLSPKQQQGSCCSVTKLSHGCSPDC